jgi:hypothetical protein
MRGLFRDQDDWVRVRYESGRELDMPKARYVALKHQPPFEELPLIEGDTTEVVRESLAGP